MIDQFAGGAAPMGSAGAGCDECTVRSALGSAALPPRYQFNAMDTTARMLAVAEVFNAFGTVWLQLLDDRADGPSHRRGHRVEERPHWGMFVEALVRCGPLAGRSPAATQAEDGTHRFRLRSK